MIGGKTGAEVTIGYEFKGATDFTCFDSPAPPKPAPVTPPAFPTKGVGKPCTGLSDTCDGDATLCCGVALNGEIIDGTGGKPTGAKNLPAAAMCNKKPDADGNPQG